MTEISLLLAQTHQIVQRIGPDGSVREAFRALNIITGSFSNSRAGREWRHRIIQAVLAEQTKLRLSIIHMEEL